MLKVLNNNVIQENRGSEENMNLKQMQTYHNSIKTLRRHHVRITPQRQLLLRFLITNHSHPTIDQIYLSLQKQMSNMSIATIYNNLRVFNRYGITVSLPGKNGRVRFDYFGQPHFYAICNNCGRIFDVADQHYQQLNRKLKQLAKKQTGFQSSGIKVEILGICPICQKKLKNE